MSTKRLWDARDLVCSHKQIFEKKNGCLLWAIAAGAYFEVKVKCFCSKVSRFQEVVGEVVGEESFCCQLGILNYVQTGLQSLETLYQLHDCKRKIDYRGTSFTRIIQYIYRFIISFFEIFYLKYIYVKMYHFFCDMILVRKINQILVSVCEHFL